MRSAGLKRLLTSSIIVLLSCSSKKPAAPAETVYYPYAPVYSNDYAQGSAVLAKKVVDFWKAYESGDVTHTAGNFADSVTFILPDVSWRGSRDSVLALMKKRRQRYSDMQCYLDSWIPLHEKNHGDDLVVLWGRQDGTTPKGARDYMVLHETWYFDRKGRIQTMIQYLTHPH